MIRQERNMRQRPDAEMLRAIRREVRAEMAARREGDRLGRRRRRPGEDETLLRRRDVWRQEMLSYRRFQDNLQTIADPELRQAVEQAVEDAVAAGFGYGEVLRALQGLGRGGFPPGLGTPFGRGFLWGAAAAVLGITVLPTAWKSVKDGDLLREMRAAMGRMREDAEDAAAQAKFAHLEQTIEDGSFLSKAPGVEK